MIGVSVDLGGANPWIGRRFFLILSFMAWSLGVGGLGAAESREPTERQLRAVFREQSFSGVNVAEAKAALGTLIRMLGEGRGYDVEPVILVARDDEEYVRWIREGQFDLTAMDPWLYVKHGLDPYVRLDAVAEDEQGLAKRFQVVTRTDSGLNSIGRLAGKKIIARDLIHSDLGRQWLEALLTRGGFGTAAEFFGSFETSPKSAGVVLPVYFGVRDVALVDAGGLASVVEQNAQVGRSLRTVASSPHLSNLLMGTRNGRWPSESHRAVVVEGVLDLESIPEGRRVLALFRIRRFVEVPENQLATVRALHEGSVEVAADGARPAEDPGL